MEGQVIQQDDRMCSTEEDEKKEGKIYTHTLLRETQHLRDSTFWESQHLGAPIDFIFLWSGQCQGSVPVQGAESHQPSATSHLG